MQLFFLKNSNNSLHNSLYLSIIIWRLATPYKESSLTFWLYKTLFIDINFFTKEQLSISDSILTFFATYGTNIKVEPGVCFFLELNDGWNACLSTDGIIDLYKPILFFYKVDKSYSRAESLTDWNSFYYNK